MAAGTVCCPPTPAGDLTPEARVSFTQASTCLSSARKPSIDSEQKPGSSPKLHSPELPPTLLFSPSHAYFGPSLTPAQPHPPPAHIPSCSPSGTHTVMTRLPPAWKPLHLPLSLTSLTLKVTPQRKLPIYSFPQGPPHPSLSILSLHVSNHNSQSTM